LQSAARRTESVQCRLGRRRPRGAAGPLLRELPSALRTRSRRCQSEHRYQPPRALSLQALDELVEPSASHYSQALVRERRADRALRSAGGDGETHLAAGVVYVLSRFARSDERLRYPARSRERTSPKTTPRPGCLGSPRWYRGRRYRHPSTGISSRYRR
jgi:hypothetical protein